MYHIDRNDQLQLTANDKLYIDNSKINVTFRSLLKRIQNLLPNYEHTTTLSELAMNDSFPIREEFDRWNLEEILPSDRIYVHKFRVELLYEYVRVTNFSSKVSRIGAFYLTKNPNEWMESLKVKEGTQLYEFISTNSKTEEYDATWPELSMEIIDFDTIISQAINYWKGLKTENSRIEILCTGELKVLQKFTITYTNK